MDRRAPYSGLECLWGWGTDLDYSMPIDWGNLTFYYGKHIPIQMQLLSLLHLVLLRGVNPRRRWLPFIFFFFLGRGHFCTLSVNLFGFVNFLLGSFLHETVYFLFVYLPPVVFAIMPMLLFGLCVSVCCQPAEKFPPHSLNFVLVELVPYLLLFVLHLVALDVRANSGLCFFSTLIANIAGGVINPLYSKVGITIKIVSDFFIRHVVNTEQVPGIRAYGCVIGGEIRCRSLFKEFCVRGRWLLSGLDYTLTSGKNLSARSLIFRLRSCISAISSRRICSRYWILPVSSAFCIL